MLFRLVDDRASQRSRRGVDGVGDEGGERRSRVRGRGRVQGAGVAIGIAGVVGIISVLRRRAARTGAVGGGGYCGSFSHSFGSGSGSGSGCDFSTGRCGRRCRRRRQPRRRWRDDEARGEPVAMKIEEAVVGPVAGGQEEDEEQGGAVDAGAVQRVRQGDEGEQKERAGVGRDEEEREPTAKNGCQLFIYIRTSRGGGGVRGIGAQ